MASVNGTRGLVTETQRLYYAAIVGLYADLGRPPTIAEVAKKLDRSRTAAWNACRQLEAAGHLVRDDAGCYRPIGGTT